MDRHIDILEKQEQMIRKARQMEETRLPEDLPYLEMEHLRLEARQKLSERRPATVGIAARIPGVSPADISVLLVALTQYGKGDENRGTDA